MTKVFKFNWYFYPVFIGLEIYMFFFLLVITVGLPSIASPLIVLPIPIICLVAIIYSGYFRIQNIFPPEITNGELSMRCLNLKDSTLFFSTQNPIGCKHYPIHTIPVRSLKIIVAEWDNTPAKNIVFPAGRTSGREISLQKFRDILYIIDTKTGDEYMNTDFRYLNDPYGFVTAIEEAIIDANATSSGN